MLKTFASLHSSAHAHVQFHQFTPPKDFWIRLWCTFWHRLTWESSPISTIFMYYLSIQNLVIMIIQWRRFCTLYGAWAKPIASTVSRTNSKGGRSVEHSWRPACRSPAVDLEQLDTLFRGINELEKQIIYNSNLLTRISNLDCSLWSPWPHGNSHISFQEI